MSDSLNYSNSNLNSSEEVYLSLVNSYINASKEILNGYMTFETGLTRAINSQIFRNFTRSSFSGTRTTVTTQPESVQTEPERQPEPEPTLETPVNLIRRETQLPNTPIRPMLRFRSTLPSSSSAPSSPFQVPTPVRLTARLDTPPQERESRESSFILPRRVSLQQQQQQSESNSVIREEHDSLSQRESQNVVMSSSAPTPTPPFSSTFVRYRLPVAIGPPRRASSTNANTDPPTTFTSSTRANRNALELPVISPDNSPPAPPPPQLSLSPPSVWASQTWQQLRQNRQERQQQQQQLNSLSPIHPIEPTPLPPAPALAPLTSATRLMLNLLDTPRLNDTLVYYTQIIDREFTRSQQGQGQVNGPLSYDVIQQETKIIPYCTIPEPLNDICPISQIPFDLVDSVMQINICKHNFNPFSLLRWFDSNSTCPMCRQQINVNYNHGDVEDREDDEQTIHMYNNGREEEPYRSSLELNRDYDNDSRYNDESDLSSVG
jgi:hypothetical protein